MQECVTSVMWQGYIVDVDRLLHSLRPSPVARSSQMCMASSFHRQGNGASSDGLTHSDDLRTAFAG
ncbi:hypothetical protein A9G02_03175 [Cutibacterium avidum]|nr:hypothetical protein A9G02_03175 [Cutibacterium avidum]